jgi:hypothetical protein
MFDEGIDEMRVISLKRDDSNIKTLNATSFQKTINIDQLEFLQSRLVLTPVAVSGGEYSPYSITAAGYQDGTCDVWSLRDGHKLFTLYHGAPVSTVWISPNGELLVTICTSYLVFWCIPQDPEVTPPSRLPLRSAVVSAFFAQGEFHVNATVTQPQILEGIGFTKEEKLITQLDIRSFANNNSTILKIAQAMKGDVSDIWVVVKDDTGVILYNISQKLGLVAQMRWPHQDGDPFVSADFCDEENWTEGDPLCAQQLLLVTKGAKFMIVNLLCLSETQVVVSYKYMTSFRYEDMQQFEDTGVIVDSYFCGKSMKAMLLLQDNKRYIVCRFVCVV